MPKSRSRPQKAQRGPTPAPAAKPPPPPPAGKPRSRAAAWIGLTAAGVAALVGVYFLWPDIRVGAGAGSEPGLIEKVESLYNDIYVYKQGNGHYVLSFGAKRLRYVESIVNPDDELDLPVYYTQSMTAGLAYASGLEDAMIIGLGGGRTAWYHHISVPTLRMKAVELDPQVARIADEYFGVRPEKNFEVAIEDGRVHLTRDVGRYDIIMVDAYRGPFVPFHLLTTEFYEQVAAHLKPGGVVVQNVEPSTMLFDSAVATIKAAFDHVVFVSGQGNIVILAYDGPEKYEAEVRRIAEERQAKYGFRYDITAILDRRFNPTWDESTEPLTDDFAPVEYLKAIDRHNEKQS